MINIEADYNGFIASVEKPRDLKVISTDERVSIDLYANGRLREKDILKYMPSARIVENYLYGQIHYSGLDDDTDRFSSNREGIVADDPKFIALIESLKDNALNKIIGDWDEWRLKHRKTGDPDNERIPEKDRMSIALYHSVSGEYIPPEGSANKASIDNWIDELADDAKYNFGSYAECFVSENLIRKYTVEKNIELSEEARSEVAEMRRREERNKRNGNININLRQEDYDISYLDIKDLANLVDRQRGNENCLPSDAKEYKPIRDALMHTALLTNEAKRKLTTVYENIKGRVNTLLNR
ncbi:hypothetical protein ACFLT4_07155 [Chloroflexota bacterium]